MTKKKLLRAGLAVTTFCLLSLSAIPMANAQVAQEIIVGQTVPVGSLPVTRVDGGQHVLLRVINPTSQPVAFSVPELGINYPVRPHSEKTFFVDMGYVMDNQIAYSVTCPTGGQLASGVLVNEDYLLIGDQATVAALNTIMNYSTAYTAEIEPEPTYGRPASFQPSRPVRGYW